MRLWSHAKRISQNLIVLILIGAASANSQIVVPNFLEDLEGNFNNNIPWNDEAPVRYQQVFAGSEVGALTALYQIRFRQDEVWGEAFSGTIPDATIVLTSIAAGPGELSMVFSENLGVDAMVVYSGLLTLRSASTGGSPNEFDIRIDLQQTFDFDPSGEMNLLMDVTIPTGPALTTFDAESTSDDSVSRVYCWTVEECLTTDDAMIADSVGLVTMFLDQAIFRDFFESGDTSAWSETVP